MEILTAKDALYQAIENNPQALELLRHIYEAVNEGKFNFTYTLYLNSNNEDENEKVFEKYRLALCLLASIGYKSTIFGGLHGEKSIIITWAYPDDSGSIYNLT